MGLRLADEQGLGQAQRRLVRGVTASFCTTAGVNVGDHIDFALRLADASIPVELENILAGDDGLAAA